MMKTIRTIKIFLASSNELENDRMSFGNLVRKLDMIYEKRGIRVALFEWEDYDAAYNGVRKQDEYNQHIKESDMFLALFHTKAGKYTIEEFNLAINEFKQHKSPKVYVYCKDLKPNETELPELTEFKQHLDEKLCHFWCSYGNRDTMQLNFVMQLQQVENNILNDELEVDENGQVTLRGLLIARMSELPFAAGNESYQSMSSELLKLNNEIEDARQRLEKSPEDEDLKDDLQYKLDRYNHLKEEFANLQHNLLSTAQAIANLQQQQVSSRLRQAIKAFESGDLKFANYLLEKIKNEAVIEGHIEAYEKSMQIAGIQQQTVYQDIESFHLQTKTIMSDVSIPINERVDRVEIVYSLADDWASRSNYDKEKYASILADYVFFLLNRAHHDKAKEISLRQIKMCEELFGTEHPETAKSYNLMGLVCNNLGDYSEALEYHLKAINIQEKLYGPNDPKIASDYHNISMVYSNLGDNQRALECLSKVIDIEEREKSPHVVVAYLSIGLVYDRLGEYDKALEYYFKAYDGIEEVEEIPERFTATLYNNIGTVYCKLGEISKALEYDFMALEIYEKNLGSNHPEIAMLYNDIALAYESQGDYSDSLEYFLKALDILKRILGEEHPLTMETYENTASIYNGLGMTYNSIGYYPQALEYFMEELDIYKRIYGEDHPETATTYDNIGLVYKNQAKYDEAKDYYLKALVIEERVLGTEHPNTARTYNNIASIFRIQGDYNRALEFFFKSLGIFVRCLGEHDPHTATCYNNIGEIYCSIGAYDTALEYYSEALNIFEKSLGPEHINTAHGYNNIGAVYAIIGQYDKALEYIGKALFIWEKLLGKDHPDTKAVRVNYERILKRKLES